jgi:cobalt-zinc-cadmium efflux system outer membrane protein
MRIAEAAVDAALGQLKVARELPNPTLGLSTAKISTDGVPEGTSLGNGVLDRSYDSIVSLSQLFLVGKRGLLRDAASAGLNAAQSQLEDERRLLVEAVTQAYAAALAAGRQADVLTESAAKLRREADIAAHRYKAGDISASDKAQLEIAADQDELGAQAQRAAARTAVVTLEILLGNPAPKGDTPLSDSLEPWVRAIPRGLEDEPVGVRPDVAAAESALAEAEANVTLQRRQRLPDVTASVQFERNPSAQPDTVGIGLSLPLPLWNHYTGEILAAKAARNQSEAQLDKVRIQAAADVTNARVAFHEAYLRLSRYEDSLVPKSAEVARSVAYSYEKGGASLLDLLEAERSDNLIRLAHVQAQADTASTAVALQSALGKLEASQDK